MPDEELSIDFGDPELNDPEYETKVDAAPEADDATETAPVDGAQEAAPSEQEQAPAVESQSQDGSGSGSNAQTPQADGKQQSAAAQRPQSDAKGNLIGADGKVIAKAGPERRHYERVQAQDTHIKRLEADLKKAQQERNYAQALGGAPDKLGLNMQETEMGLQAIASFKKDPVATARWMLQETMRLGYNLDQIVGDEAGVQGGKGSLDLQAVKSMIAEQVAPLVGDRKAQQETVQRQEAARREYDAFVAKYDNVSVHEDTLARMLQQDPSLTPDVAYWQLREYTAKNGLDFSKPLREQVVARQQGGQQQPQGNANPQAQTRPMPNGGAATANMQNGPTMYAADDAWDTIVQNSLRDAGFA